MTIKTLKKFSEYDSTIKQLATQLNTYEQISTPVRARIYAAQVSVNKNHLKFESKEAR